MKDEEFTPYELQVIAAHEEEMLEEDISIYQAVREFNLDKMSRDALEKTAARSLLELSNLEDLVSQLSKSQRESILEILAFQNGKPIGRLKVALEKGIEQQKDEQAKQKSEIARKNAQIGVSQRKATIALNKMELEDYPSHMKTIHLEGRQKSFVNKMRHKYPEIESDESIERRVRKLNEINGIKIKKVTD